MSLYLKHSIYRVGTNRSISLIFIHHQFTVVPMLYIIMINLFLRHSAPLLQGFKHEIKKRNLQQCKPIHQPPPIFQRYIMGGGQRRILHVNISMWGETLVQVPHRPLFGHLVQWSTNAPNNNSIELTQINHVNIKGV